VTQESPRTAGAIRQWLERAAEARPEWEYVPLARSLLEDIAGNRVEADRCFDQAQAISQSAYAAATGSRDDEPRLPRPSIRQLLGPDVFPPIHWAVRLQLAGLLSGPHETLWPSRAAVPMPPGSLPTEECAEIAFSPLPWPGRGSTGGGDPLAEGNVRESDRMLSYTAAALEQARTDPAPGRITSRTLVLFLATLGCVILIDLLLVERLGSLWGIIALLPLTALLFPGFYFLLDLLLDLTAG
jgi:hypothetical protein